MHRMRMSAASLPLITSSPCVSLHFPFQVPDSAHSDHLVLRRLAIAREDPIRAVDAREAVKAAAAKVRG